MLILKIQKKIFLFLQTKLFVFNLKTLNSLSLINSQTNWVLKKAITSKLASGNKTNALDNMLLFMYMLLGVSVLNSRLKPSKLFA